MNNKHKKTLRSIFENPVKPNILWSDIEKLFVALGATVMEGAGSRVCVLLNGARAVFHRPHPEKETEKGAIRSVRQFLKNAGVLSNGI